MFPYLFPLASPSLPPSPSHPSRWSQSTELMCFCSDYKLRERAAGGAF